MMRIGITGGVATGKSTVTRLLRDLGALTFSGDEAARAVLTPGGPVLKRLRESFGDGIFRASQQTASSNRESLNREQLNIESFKRENSGQDAMKAMKEGGNQKRSVEESHPGEGDGELDRASLGRLIFADPEARQRLNAIMHPPIIRLLRAQVEACEQDFNGRVVVVEVPLLFESGLDGQRNRAENQEENLKENLKWNRKPGIESVAHRDPKISPFIPLTFERIIVVSASESVQVARLIVRNHLDPEEARRRVAAQMPMAEKERRADRVILNDADSETLKRRVEDFWRELTKETPPGVTL